MNDDTESPVKKAMAQPKVIDATAAIERAMGKRSRITLEQNSTASSTPALANKSGGGKGGKHTPQEIEILKSCAKLDANDLGNALRLLAWHGDDIVFVADGPGWHHWCGTHWQVDGGALKVRALAQTISERIKEEAAWIELYPEQQAMVEAAAQLRGKSAEDRSPADAKALKDADALTSMLADIKSKRRSFAITTGNAARTTAMLQQAVSQKSVEPKVLDRDLFKLNIANGTLRFWRENDDDCPDPDIVRRIGRVELLPHDRADLITRLAEVDYRPEAIAPQWKSFLDRVQPDRTIQRFLQVSHGYAALIGGNDEQRMIYHFGRGANGKSAFIETIGRVLGSYRAVTSPESFSGSGQRQGNQQNSDMARLFNTRLVTVEELPKGEPLKEYLIKQFTGGSRLVARFLNREWFEFDPTFTAVMAGNDMPTISGMDHGIWRRLIIVPWRIEVPEAERKPFGELLAEFEAERSGILNWLVEGALLWLADGLVAHIPAEIREFTEKHREDRDVLGNFIAAYVVRDPTGKVQAKALLDAFTSYCDMNGIKPWHQTTVGNSLKAMGFEKEQGRHVHYLGIRLVDPPSRFDPAPPSHHER